MGKSKENNFDFFFAFKIDIFNFVSVFENSTKVNRKQVKLALAELEKEMEIFGTMQGIQNALSDGRGFID